MRWNPPARCIERLSRFPEYGANLADGLRFRAVKV
jgi:hypothetical protein